MKIKDKTPSRKQFNNLVKEIAQGKKSALEDFYSAYGRLVYSVALSVSKSSYLADEIVNSVLVKIWQVSKYLKDIKNPVAWLYAVTANCAKDKLRAEKKYDEIYDIPQEDKNIEEILVNDSFNSKISYLDEEEKRIMIMRFIQDLSFKSIAKELNKPTSTVSSIYYRAIEKLKKIL